MSVAIWLGERADNYSDAKSVYVTATSVFSDFMNQILKGQKTEDFITAADPDYDETYFDAKYHIGTSGSWEYSEQDYAGGSSSYYSSSSSSSSSASSTYSTDSERSYGDALGSTYDDSDYSDSGPSGGLAQTMTSVSGTG
jgi:hypothetical protein